MTFGITVGDFGHSATKMRVDLTEVEFPHLVARISEDDFQAAARSNPRRNPFLLHVRNPQRGIDGFFAVGDAAARSGTTLKREQRYHADYIGPMMCAGWAAAYDEGPPKFREHAVTALYPANDSHASDALRVALSGNWTVKCANCDFTYKFSVRQKRVRTIPEPMGGLFNVLLDEYGNQYADWRDGFNPMIIDIGGGTMSVVELGTNYTYTRADIGPSYNVGVNDALDDFVKHLYDLGVVKSAVGADRNFLRGVLRDGYWKGRGGKELVASVEDAIDETLDKLMATVRDKLTPHDIFAHSHIIITGGGGGLLARPLVRFLTNDEVELPESDADFVVAAQGEGIIFADFLPQIQFANVRGARKSAYIEA